MTTIGNLIDRTYRVILEPPDAQPASSRTASGITDVDQTLTLSGFDIPEDENLVRLGSIIEVDSELMRVTDFNVLTMMVTVLRGELGTEAVAHPVDATVKLSPPFPRADVFNSLRDNIVALYPDLWTVKTIQVAPSGDDAYPIGDGLAVEVVEANLPGGALGRTVNLDGRFVDDHPSVGGRAFVSSQGGLGLLWLRYRRRFGVAATEDDLLEDLGVEEVWASLLMVSVAADMMAGRDVSAANVEWVQSVLQAENITVGQRISIAGGLSQYRDILLDRFKREMRAEDSNKVKVHSNDPLAML